MLKKLVPKSEDIGERLDAVLVKHLKDYSRSQIKKWIDNGNVRVDRDPKKTSYRLKSGEEVEIQIDPPTELKTIPQNIPIDILYEDHDIIVVNKSADMVVHPAPGNLSGTLVNALLHHCDDLSGIGGVLRPGIVHRLDKGTSGVMVVAKNDLAHRKLTEQFKGRRVRKIYQAIVYGVPKTQKGLFDLEIGRHRTHRKRMSTKTKSGREALTHWEVVENFDRHISLVKIRLVTGRTHQIRVHFSAHGMPLVGDMIYGGKKTIKRLPEGRYREVVAQVVRPMLHSTSITVLHPREEREMVFEAEPPDDFMRVLEGFREISF